MNHSDNIPNTNTVRSVDVGIDGGTLGDSIESSFAYFDNNTRLEAVSAAAVSNSNSTIVNETFGSFGPELLEQFSRNRSIDGPWYHILIIMYGVLIIFGSLGNTLVVIAVVRKPMMRTARNLFILNLAISGKFNKSRQHNIVFIFIEFFVFCCSLSLKNTKLLFNAFDVQLISEVKLLPHKFLVVSKVCFV